MELGVKPDEIRKVLLGINLATIKSKPVMTIGRWKVYNAGKVPHITYSNRTLNYQINGKTNEKIVVRFFIGTEETILKIKYYYLQGTDKELAFYLTMELVARMSKLVPLDKNYIMKKLTYP